MSNFDLMKRFIKKYLPLLLLLCTNLNSKAGGYTEETEAEFDYSMTSYSLEGGVNFLMNRHADGDFLFVGFGLSPRYNFYTPKDYFSLAIGAPVSFGFDAAASEFGSLVSFYADAPLELTMNLGTSATQDGFFYLFGAFIGGGINYNYSTFTSSFSGDVNSHAFGPHVTAGLRWRNLGQVTGIRFTYMLGIYNNFEKDPAIIYERSTIPQIFNVNFFYGFY